MRVYISVDMEGIGGISHPHPTDPANVRYPGVGRADGRRDERRHRGRARGRGDRHPRQRQPLEHDQPAARASSIRRRACSRARRPGRWSPAPGPDPTGARGSTSRCSSATTLAPATRAGRSRTPTPDRRSRPASTVGRPASTASTRSSSERGASRSAWSPATTPSPTRSPTGCPWAERVVVKDGRRRPQRDLGAPDRSPASWSAPAPRRPSDAPPRASSQTLEVAPAGRHRDRVRPRRARRPRGDGPGRRADRRPRRPLPVRRSGRPRSAASSSAIRVAGTVG